MFETEEEKKEDLRKKIIVMLFIIVVAASIYTIITFWNDFKPLPNTAECEKKGYEAGLITKKGEIRCFNQCENNKILSCREMRILT